MRRVHVIVTGEVQGVGYRYTMRMVARQAGVSGWVRNRADGSVEAEIEGTPQQVEQLLEWMRHGPRYARPGALQVAEVEPTGGVDFDVRSTA